LQLKICSLLVFPKGNGKGIGFLIAMIQSRLVCLLLMVISFTAPRSHPLAGLKTNISGRVACELLRVCLLSADDNAAGMTTGVGWREGARQCFI